MVDVDKILNSVESLSTLPTIYSTISQAMENPRTSAAKIAEIIATDQVSALKVLKVANSPHFGFRGRISTISDAIFYLGFSEVKNIVFALSIINSFSKTTASSIFKPKDFWAHSIAVGIATRFIGIACGASNLENYFLGGILHDIGKLVFFQYAKNDYIELLEKASKEKLSLKQLESDVFKIDHAQIGFSLANKWKLPVTLQNSIFYHHIGNTNDDPDNLVPAVYLGNIMAKMLNLGYAGDDCIPKPNNAIWGKLKLPAGCFTSVRESLVTDHQNTIRIMLSDTK